VCQEPHINSNDGERSPNGIPRGSQSISSRHILTAPLYFFFGGRGKVHRNPLRPPVPRHLQCLTKILRRFTNSPTPREFPTIMKYVMWQLGLSSPLLIPPLPQGLRKVAAASPLPNITRAHLPRGYSNYKPPLLYFGWSIKSKAREVGSGAWDRHYDEISVQ